MVKPIVWLRQYFLEREDWDYEDIRKLERKKGASDAGWKKKSKKNVTSVDEELSYRVLEESRIKDGCIW